MKKIISALFLICVVFVACEIENDETTSGYFSIKDVGIKSLYISDIPIGNGRAASGSTIQTLSYINNLGQNTPFYFVSPSGKNIVLNVNEVRQLDHKRILVDFTSYYTITANGNTFTIGETNYESGRALIDMESGKVYDFKEYNNVQFVYNDLLFSLENQTLYKIDLNDITTAVPLNNPNFVPLTNSYFPGILNNKWFGYQYLTAVDDIGYSVDINNGYIPMVINDAYITPNECSFLNSHKVGLYRGGGNGIVILDLEKNVWYYIRENDKYFIGKVSIDNMGNESITDYVEGVLPFDLNTPYGEPLPFLLNSTGNGKISRMEYGWSNNAIMLNLEYFYNSGMVMIYEDGFIVFKKKASGIVIRAVALSLPVVNQWNSLIKDNYLYYVKGTSISRIYLDSDSSSETIYTNQRLYLGVNDKDAIIASGDYLIFYQYGEDNLSVNTYSLAMYQPGATPKFMASSSIDVRDIIELDF